MTNEIAAILAKENAALKTAIRNLLSEVPIPGKIGPRHGTDWIETPSPAVVAARALIAEDAPTA